MLEVTKFRVLLLLDTLSVMPREADTGGARLLPPPPPPALLPTPPSFPGGTATAPVAHPHPPHHLAQRLLPGAPRP